MNCEFCNKEYKGSSAKSNIAKHKIHCSLNPVGIKYKCDLCDKEFENRHAIIAHKKGCGKAKKKRNYKKPKEERITTCKFCGYENENYFKLGGHVTTCKLNPNYENRIVRLTEIGKDKKHTEETKKKISIARIKYLTENPDKVPYLLNHSSKESYPEKYFTEVFENEGLLITKKYRIKLYELDFCIPEKKIDIEIDGNQHYYDDKIVESDKRRTKFLEENGWDIIRINWANYQSMTYEGKSDYVKELKGYINRLTNEKPTISIVKTKKGKDLCKCGEQKWKSSKICGKCNTITQRKVERPPFEQLIKEVEELGYCGVGRKYGVSDNSIKKWIKAYKK